MLTLGVSRSWLNPAVPLVVLLRCLPCYPDPHGLAFGLLARDNRESRPKADLWRDLGDSSRAQQIVEAEYTLIISPRDATMLLGNIPRLPSPIPPHFWTSSS